jgi:mono/diheme cytochrome c family protein
VNGRRQLAVARMVTLAIYAMWLTTGAIPDVFAHTDHDHAAVPAAYADAHVPDRVWTDPAMITRGKEIYTTKCALCHGENGDGKGPAGASLPLKAGDFTDKKMVAEMAGNYWVWRVSEGGLVEPFKSKNSAMPAWKGELSMNDRWAVIAYAHTFSGHRGPHVASEHPQLKPKPKTVSGEGTVVALRPDRQQVVVEHGEIKDFMDAMTMGYKVTPASLINTVKPGDKVRFTIDTAAKTITKIDRLEK